LLLLILLLGVVVANSEVEESSGIAKPRVKDDGDVNGIEEENADIISPPRIMMVMTMTSILSRRDITR